MTQNVATEMFAGQDLFKIFAQVASGFHFRFFDFVVWLVYILVVLQVVSTGYRIYRGDYSVFADSTRRILIANFVVLLAARTDILMEAVQGWLGVSLLASGGGAQGRLGFSQLALDMLLLPADILETLSHFSLLEKGILTLPVTLMAMVALVCNAGILAQLVVAVCQGYLAVVACWFALAFKSSDLTAGYGDGYVRLAIRTAIRILMLYLVVAVARTQQVRWAERLHLLSDNNELVVGYVMAAVFFHILLFMVTMGVSAMAEALVQDRKDGSGGR